MGTRLRTTEWFLRWAYYFYHPQNIKVAARHYYEIFEKLLQRVKPYLGDIQGKRVLDIGCGMTFPFTLLFHSLGIRCTGIDIRILEPGMNLATYRKIMANREVEGYLPAEARVIQKSVNDYYYTKVFHRELRKASGLALRFEGLDLRTMDALHTTFAEGEFDLVVSESVLEHIKDVEGALKEMKRIMKTGAVAHIEIALFPSLTGGHNTLWSNPDTQEVVLGRVPSWDHLRKQLYPVDSSLNKLRESHYKKLFGENFEVLGWVTEYMEPEGYLTPEIASELSGYSREELLKRAIVVVARKA